MSGATVTALQKLVLSGQVTSFNFLKRNTQEAVSLPDRPRFPRSYLLRGRGLKGWIRFAYCVLSLFHPLSLSLSAATPERTSPQPVQTLWPCPQTAGIPSLGMDLGEWGKGVPRPDWPNVHLLLPVKSTERASNALKEKARRKTKQNKNFNSASNLEHRDLGRPDNKSKPTCSQVLSFSIPASPQVVQFSFASSR